MTTHCVKVKYLQNVEFSSLSSSTFERERDHFFGSNCLRSNPTTSHNRGEGFTSQDHHVLHEFANI